ncbi:MAG: hypothetical protein J5I90_04140 [Caldilineales bacterium]|nr:hypothetical protein [Caldilineales bacterium]
MSDPPLRNPYIVGGWVTESHFYGHIGLRYNLLHDPNRQLWVIGTRRVGKTSLLRQLAIDAGPAMISLYWDMQGCVTADDLGDELIFAVEDQEEKFAELGLAMKDLLNNEPRDQLRAVCKAAEDHGRKVLLLIDEPEVLIKIGRKDDAILRRLRASFQRHENLRVVMASTKVLTRLNEVGPDWVTSLFLQDFVPRNLSGLGAAESESLIRQTQGQTRIDAKPSVVEAIQFYTNNHPYLVQWLCYRLYQEDGSLRKPNEEDLQPDSILNALFSVIFSHLAPTERKLLIELVRAKKTDAPNLAQALGLSLRETHIYLYALDRLGYTRQIDGCTRVGNTFFETWLANNANSLSVEDSPVADAIVQEVATNAHEIEVGNIRQQLDIYRVNLAQLEVRAANYGLSVPFTIQNEIDFHQRKIAELEARLDILFEAEQSPP